MTPKEFITKIQTIFREMQEMYPPEYPVEEGIRYENKTGYVYGTAYSMQEMGVLCPFCISYKGKYEDMYYIKLCVGISGKVQCNIFRGTRNDIFCNPHIEVQKVFKSSEVDAIAKYIIQNVDKKGLYNVFIEQISWEEPVAVLKDETPL